MVGNTRCNCHTHEWPSLYIDFRQARSKAVLVDVVASWVHIVLFFVWLAQSGVEQIREKTTASNQQTLIRQGVNLLKARSGKLEILWGGKSRELADFCRISWSLVELTLPP